MMGLRLLAFCLFQVGAMSAPTFVLAQNETAATLPEAVRNAQILFLGEQHDNPSHHAVQAAWVATLQPTALVFEMLTPAQAARVTPQMLTDANELATALDWEQSGWPDFAMYYPIFAAAPNAEIYGAGVPADRVRGLMGNPLEQIDPALTARFSLDRPLPAEQQEQREALQMSAHCDALPVEMLPMMVDIQRLRDAALAGAALDAYQATGGPVVVITGNGHARTDWGAPFYVSAAAPDLAVFALGQGEAGSAPMGGFDVIADGPSVDRGDPCDAFR